MEDELCELLARSGVLCRLVGRLTHQGTRELVFQLDHWEQFRPPVGAWMGEHPEYEIDVSEHEGWEFFDRCIRPSEEDWMWMADRDVVESLIQSGSDPEKPHQIEYSFVGAAEGLRKVADVLRGRGYSPLAKLDFKSGDMVLAKTMPLDLASIFNESLANRDLAQEHGVVCDGWGAMVVE
jgi:hypothetical protein